MKIFKKRFSTLYQRPSTSSRDYLLLLGILLLSLWPLTFGISSMKWDIINLTLPWNYFISECLHHGQLPLWNPYLNAGFTQMGNPDSWYPVHWLIALIWGFDSYAMSFSYLLHLYIGGIGFYQLGKQHQFNHLAIVGTAASYMLSGFALSHAQHLGWIIGMAWLPWGWWALRRLFQQATHTNAISLAIIGHFLVSGAYPGLSIIITYLLFGLILQQLWAIRSSTYLLKKAIILLAFSFGLFLLISSPCLLAAFDISDHINRGNELSADFGKGGIFFGDLTWQGLASFILPFATSTDTTFWGSPNLSLLNCYIGLFPFLLLCLFPFQKKTNKSLWIYLMIGLLLLMTAIPRIFPFRDWINQMLPFMGYFRFPTLFRLPAIFFLLLAAGQIINKIGITKVTNLKHLLTGFKLMGLILLILLLYLANHTSGQLFKNFTLNDWGFFIETGTLIERLLLQGWIQFALISLFLLSFKFFCRTKPVTLLLFFWLLDLFLAVQLQLYFTVVETRSPTVIAKEMEALPSYFPIPRLDISLDELSQLPGNKNRRLTINSNVFHKVPSAHGDSPYSFIYTNKAVENKSFRLKKHPLLFLSHDLLKDSTVNENSILPYQPHQLELQSFYPNGFHLKSETDTATHLVFLQNYYPRWKAMVNGKEQKIVRVNDTFMAISLPAGKNLVQFKFSYPLLAKAVIISGLLCFWLWVYLIRSWINRQLFRHNTWRVRWLLLSWLLLLGIGSYRHNKRLNRKDVRQKFEASLLQLPEKFFTADTPIITSLENNPFSTFKFLSIPLWYPKDRMGLLKELDATDAGHLLIGEFYPLPSKPDWLAYSNLFYGPVAWQDSIAEMRLFLLAKKAVNPIWQSDTIRQWTNQAGNSSIEASYKGSLHLNKYKEFGDLFKKKLAKVSGSSSLKAVIRFELLNHKQYNAVVVFEVVRNGKVIHWFGQEIRPLCRANRDWQWITILQKLPDNLLPGDELKVFFWNNEKEEFWLDNAHLQLFE